MSADERREELRAALATAPPGREELERMLRDLCRTIAKLCQEPHPAKQPQYLTEREAQITAILDLVCGRPGA